MCTPQGSVSLPHPLPRPGEGNRNNTTYLSVKHNVKRLRLRPDKCTYIYSKLILIFWNPIWNLNSKFEFEKTSLKIKYLYRITGSRLALYRNMKKPVNLESLFLVCFNGILTAILFEYRQHACIMYFNLYGNDDGLN